MELKKMDKLDAIDWEKFHEVDKDQLDPQEVKLIAELHSKYYKHPYHIPCSCNPKLVVKWIDEINVIYNNGSK